MSLLSYSTYNNKQHKKVIQVDVLVHKLQLKLCEALFITALLNDILKQHLRLTTDGSEV